jgi:tRNA-dihydrouridine synthase B
LFNRIRHFLTHGSDLPSPEWDAVRIIVLEHVAALHQFYGEYKGVRFARKHVAWYLERYGSAKHFRRGFNALTSAEEQLDALELFFSNAIA